MNERDNARVKRDNACERAGVKGGGGRTNVRDHETVRGEGE